MSWLQHLIIDSHNKSCACYVYSFSQRQLQTGKDGCDLVKFSAAFFGSHIYSELDDILTVLWVLVELLWKKGRCLLSSPDLCAARGKLYPKLTFPLCHLWLTCTPKQATIFQPAFVRHPVSLQRQPLTPASSQHVQGSEVILVWWRESEKSHCWRILVIVVFFRIMGEGGLCLLNSQQAHGKSLLISSSLFSHTSRFLFEWVTDWLNTLMINLSTDAYSFKNELFMP